MIESLAEGLVDGGVLGPFLFYGLFGIIGAMVYRAANNLDSTVGYKDSTYILFGRPAALIDTLFNYVPARVSPAFIAWRGEATGRRARGSAIEFAGLTDSANAGWPMSAMAKLLGVWLEKPGEYIINEGGRNPPTPPLT
ncbi:cobalamin biosynthesis protein [Thermogymnomonas acidicola]|uniref:CobD/CbiB family cobalamin biosynthesis protein n=1 Tax=Thermogymnomonas acidicola TaxID=399579 RepID=UPI0009466DC8|nr:CobD/CbiB family cobalamin biosynthesis protein [Thermogymnomonas acidicola]